MTIKKSDLYRSLWASCDELRGGMDASQYKDYILTLLFVKYVSDKYESDEDALIQIPAGGAFADIWALKGKPNIGEGIDKAIGRLADANDLRGVIDVAYFNDDEKLGKGKEMVDRLSKLVTIFNNLDFRSNRADGDDLLGDAYEYLMRHFATESGKSKGQFYTPAEVSQILAKVVGIGPKTKPNQSVYDPTCGSGSLLLKAADEAPHTISIYGQEKDVATWALAKMNMILHGYETAEIWKGDAITSPGFTTGGHLKLHDFIVANPPFSTKSWSSGISPSADEYNRFGFGVPPTRNGDYAFLLHAIASLKSTGKSAMILPHGVLFRGNTEATIRANLLKGGLIRGVIGLPANLFYGTGIPACIVVVDKEMAAKRKSVFMIDAAKGFVKDGNKNRLRSQDIHRIVDTFNTETEIPGYSRLVPLDEIADSKNDYNLNLARYIDSSEPEDLQDLDAHLHGGVPDHDLELLADFWSNLPSLRGELFEDGTRPGYRTARVDADEVQKAIESNSEFASFEGLVAEKLRTWYDAHRSRLIDAKEGTPPKPIVFEMSEDLLQRFADVPLVNRYDVYECLMTYWADVMQDDVYLVSADGWEEASQPHIALDDKERKISEVPDLIVGTGKSAKKFKMDLLPPSLIIGRFFSEDRVTLDEFRVVLELATAELAECVEENGFEGGLIEDVVDDKGKVTKKALTAQIKMLRSESDRADELEAVKRCAELLEAEAGAKKRVKEAQDQLNAAVLAKYSKLTEDEIKEVVIEDKWREDIARAVSAIARAIALLLAARVRQLDLRYRVTLPELESTVRESSDRVHGQLKRMGFA